MVERLSGSYCERITPGILPSAPNGAVSAALRRSNLFLTNLSNLFRFESVKRNPYIKKSHPEVTFF